MTNYWIHFEEKFNSQKECKSTIDWTPGQTYLGPNWKRLILFKETNKYDADGAGWDNAVAGLQIMISCPKGWGTHTPKCFLNHHHHRQHFTQPTSQPPSPPPLPKCPPPLTEIFLLILIVWVAFRAWLNPNEGNVGSLPVTSTHLHRLETGEVNQCDARPNMAK